jgi:TRAP-type C4-dicarboxylate transport system substrate-binding protein
MEILKDFKFAAYTPNVTIVDLPVVSFAVVMNKDKWNSLPQEVKKVFDELRREQALWTATYVDDHVKEALEWAKKEYSLKIINLSKAERAEITKTLRPMIDEYIKKADAAGLPGEKIIRDIEELKKRYEKQYK